ncbi:MAG: 1,4-dihydroxy-6-naphthoate synthase [Bacteroidota bacterium]
MKIKLGFSTCPNDTFMFDALVNGKIDTGGFEFEIILGDILHLNKMASEGELDMVKISYNTYGRVREQYHLLNSGSALGHNCGPLLISKSPLSAEEIEQGNLAVAIPGKHTTANLLLGYFSPNITHKKVFLFHEIMPAILSGEVEAGVIIHENRFTYQDHGLQLIQDLGEYWESKTQLPIPLGAIVANKELGIDVVEKLNSLMRESVQYAFSNPEASKEFVKTHAQEMDEKVMQSHIDLYVNEYSVSLGDQGKKAVHKLLEVGEGMGLY